MFFSFFFLSSSLQFSEAPLAPPGGPPGGRGPHFENHCVRRRVLMQMLSVDWTGYKRWYVLVWVCVLDCVS